jgi:hypothetical protein
VSHTHDGEHPCSKPSKKACDVAYVQWQARSQVMLAARIVANMTRDQRARWRKDSTIFGQLVAVLDSRQEDIMNEDGNPSQSPFVIRLREALAGYRRPSSG